MSRTPHPHSENRKLFLRRLCTPPWFTLALVGLLVLVFLRLEPWLDSRHFAERVLFGAFVGELFEAGEIYRLATASLLHQDWPHLVNNLLGLIFFGWLVEAAIGAKRTALLLFLAGTAGYALMIPSLVSWEEFSLSVGIGSSGAVWGLLGASVVITTQGRRDLPVGFCVPLFVWAMIAIHLVSQLGFEMRSIVVHLGGGVLGLLSMAYLIRNDGVLPLPDTPRLTPMVAVVTSTVLVAGIFAVRNDRLYGNQPYVALVHQRMASPLASDAARNNFAWVLAVMNEVPQQSMQVALGIMREVVARDPKAEFRDTLATLYYRAGEPRRAVEIARAIWWEGPDYWAATQLARFYAAAHHVISTERAAENELAPSADEFARIDVIRPEEPGMFEFVIVLAELDPAPALIHALVYRAGELHSLLELDVDWVLRGGRCDLPTAAIPGLDPDTLSVRAVWYGTPDPSAVSVVTACRLKTLHSDANRLP